MARATAPSGPERSCTPYRFGDLTSSCFAVARTGNTVRRCPLHRRPSGPPGVRRLRLLPGRRSGRTVSGASRAADDGPACIRPIPPDPGRMTDLHPTCQRPIRPAPSGPSRKASRRAGAHLPRSRGRGGPGCREAGRATPVWCKPDGPLPSGAFDWIPSPPRGSIAQSHGGSPYLLKSL